MSYLVFCSAEVGGLPFRMAEILNRRGVATAYVSLSPAMDPHDSTAFHYGDRREPWDFSARFKGKGYSAGEAVRLLGDLRREEGITGCLATGALACLLEGAGIPYRYWCYGSDLDQQSFSPVWPGEGYPWWKKPLTFSRFALTVRRRQRLSIRRAEAVMIAPYQARSLARIRPGAKLFFLPHCLEAPDRETLLRERAASRDSVRDETGAGRFFFSAARHVWEGRLARLSDNKGNDVALRSFAGYREMTGDTGARFLTVRKGPDQEASRLLAERLGISGALVWLEERPREDLRKFYLGATLCFGQFGTPVISYAALEPLAFATPCISYAGENPPDPPFYEEDPPLLNSRDPGEIARFMARIAGDEAFRRELGERSWRWVGKHCSEEAFAAAFVRTFEGG